MSYQETTTPRFFIDYLQYYYAIGKAMPGKTEHIWNTPINTGTNLTRGLVGLNPSWDVRTKGLTAAAHGGWNVQHFISSFPVHQMNCIGLLGHNLVSAPGSATFGMAYHTYNSNGDSTWHYAQNSDPEIKINCTGTQSAMTPTFDGFSFSSTNETNQPDLDPVEGTSWVGCVVRSIDDATNDFEHRIGSNFWGRYWNMPMAADLSMTMSIDMDGVDQKTSKGGSTLSNATHFGPPDWGNLPAWTLSGDAQSTAWSEEFETRRPGRRSWKLSFSYLSQEKMFPGIATHTSYFNPEAYDDGVNANIAGGWNDLNSDSQDNFISQIWSKTLGPHLPFVFQPDKDNDSPDTFAICRFKENSLQIEKIANSLYKISVTIVESW